MNYANGVCVSDELTPAQRRIADSKTRTLEQLPPVFRGTAFGALICMLCVHTVIVAVFVTAAVCLGLLSGAEIFFVITTACFLACSLGVYNALALMRRGARESSVEQFCAAAGMLERVLVWLHRFLIVTFSLLTLLSVLFALFVSDLPGNADAADRIVPAVFLLIVSCAVILFSGTMLRSCRSFVSTLRGVPKMQGFFGLTVCSTLTAAGIVTLLIVLSPARSLLSVCAALYGVILALLNITILIFAGTVHRKTAKLQTLYADS